VSSVIWGIGMLADAAVRVVMSCTLPISVVPGLGGALWPVTFVVLQVITNVYYSFAGLNAMLGARWLNRPPRARRSVAELPSSAAALASSAAVISRFSRTRRKGRQVLAC
jgi:hypothetical protein